MKLVNQAQETDDSADESSLDRMVQNLLGESEKLNDIKDVHGRTIFHAAVEEKWYSLVKILLSSGAILMQRKVVGQPRCQLQY